MGLFGNMSAGAGEVLSAGIGFLGNLGGSVAGGLFSANQAKKNRAFQERMYNKQYQDSIDFWKMQQDYNLPSAQLERLRQAHLSPLLMYGEGGISGNLASQAPQLPSAPHGAQGQVSSFNTRIELANLALVNAQAKALEAQAKKDTAEAGESQSRTANWDYDVMFKRLSKDVDIALKHGRLSEIFASTDNLRQQAYSTGQMTLQSTLTMMQAREYEIKRFNLDANTIGEQLAQRWKEIANGTIAANAQMKSAFAQMLNAKANWNLSNAQIGQIALNMSQSRQMFPLLYENQENANWSQIQDRMFKGVQITNAQKDGFTKDMDNWLRSHGTGPDTWLYKVAGPFILPTIYVNDKMHGRDPWNRYPYGN